MVKNEIVEKKKKPNILRRYWWVVLIVVIVISSVVIYTSVKPKQQTELEKRIQLSLDAETKKTTRQTDLPLVMFNEIDANCTFPQDFYAVRMMWLYSMIRPDSPKITECYWKQPEWWYRFEEDSVPLLKNIPVGRYYACCPGLFPADEVIKITKSDNPVGDNYEFTTYTYIRSGSAVELYQGVAFTKEYPEKSTITESIDKTYSGFVAEQDPEIAKQYINFTVEPSYMLLAPSFPIFKWDSKGRIGTHISVSKDIPKGTYIIGFYTDLPPKDVNDKWVDEYLTKYNNPYTGSMFSPRRYRLYIMVE